MKTLQDLVDELNKNGLSDDEFSMSGDEQHDYFIDLGRTPIIVFSLRDRTYSFCPFITYVRDKDQDLIVKYLANHTPDDWFVEGKVEVKDEKI